MAATAPDDPAWTDGTTVFIDAAGEPRSQVTALAVQASLLAAGSLAPDVVRKLRTSRNATRRYLAIEGHRALALNEAYLPWAVRATIDRDVASSVDGIDGSLAVAFGRRAGSAGAVVLRDDPAPSASGRGRAQRVRGSSGRRRASPGKRHLPARHGGHRRRRGRSPQHRAAPQQPGGRRGSGGPAAPAPVRTDA